jgi:hypothetical protein
VKNLLQSPSFGLFGLALVALLGDIVAVLQGHGTVPLLDSVVLAALTGGAVATTPAAATKSTAPADSTEARP